MDGMSPSLHGRYDCQLRLGSAGRGNGSPSRFRLSRRGAAPSAFGNRGSAGGCSDSGRRYAGRLMSTSARTCPAPSNSTLLAALALPAPRSALMAPPPLSSSSSPLPPSLPPSLPPALPVHPCALPPALSSAPLDSLRSIPSSSTPLSILSLPLSEPPTPCLSCPSLRISSAYLLGSPSSLLPPCPSLLPIRALFLGGRFSPSSSAISSALLPPPPPTSLPPPA